MVYLLLWKMMEWTSVGVIIPNIWKNKKCSKPPTSIIEIENTNIWNHQPNEKSMLHWKSLWPTSDSMTSHHVITFRLSWLPKTYKNTRPSPSQRSWAHLRDALRWFPQAVSCKVLPKPVKSLRWRKLMKPAAKDLLGVQTESRDYRDW